jgi:hypothetical protein
MKPRHPPDPRAIDALYGLEPAFDPGAGEVDASGSLVELTADRSG